MRLRRVVAIAFKCRRANNECSITFTCATSSQKSAARAIRTVSGIGTRRPIEHNVAGHASAMLRGMPNDIQVAWADLKIPDADFNVAALHTALETQRAERGMSWKAAAHEINRADDRYGVRPISPSTI